MQLAQLRLFLATIAIIGVFAVATLYRFKQDQTNIPVTRKHVLPMVRESITVSSSRKRLPHATNTDATQRYSPLSTATSTQQERNIQHLITPRLVPLR